MQYVDCVVYVVVYVYVLGDDMVGQQCDGWVGGYYEFVWFVVGDLIEQWCIEEDVVGQQVQQVDVQQDVGGNVLLLKLLWDVYGNRRYLLF